ncbi:MAG: 3'-5' exonuclease [Thermoanaerobaculaceae bacterium]|nr:3'-5' exonuclease [Thermoanaerobaculaceae bacterium]
MESPADTAFISVDVETAGPNPAQYSLLSLGACLVFDPANTFYVEVQPVTDAFVPEAMQITGLDMEQLRAHGLAPEQAMRQFSEWVLHAVPGDRQPVFVALNAAFDWMFVADYFHRYLGRNPFGHKALDIKALFMGVAGTDWDETGFGHIAKHFQIEQPLTHHALEDAVAQAGLFRKILEEARSRARP